MPKTWKTVGEAQSGIERFLVNGPKGMDEIIKYAAKHGIGQTEAVGIVGRLVEAERLITVIKPFSKDHPSGVYRLSEWNADELQNGPPEIATCEHGTPWTQACHEGNCFREEK